MIHEYATEIRAKIYILSRLNLFTKNKNKQNKVIWNRFVHCRITDDGMYDNMQ